MPAHMIPPIPKEFDEKSDEGIVFNALKKLPSDYYVFHNVTTTVVDNNIVYERELDFVIANAQKGILCIEAKNGKNIHYEDRTWKYSSGRPMDHDGPYNQIATGKRAIISKIKCHANEKVRRLYGRCKVMHAVFFFRMSQIHFDDMVKAGLPEDADPRITLLAEDLINPTSKIESIFSLKIPAQLKYSAEETKLTNAEFKLLLDSVLCPSFNLIPSPTSKNIVMIDQMNQLLREQYVLLDFLEEQNTAVINGAAGTGKTMIAVEKARRNSINGDKVLFLCYNNLLCKNLNSRYKESEDKEFKNQFKNVDFKTISKLTKDVTGNYRDIDGLMEWLIDCLGDVDKFGYKHVIVDEGQDFGIVDASLGTTKDQARQNCSIIDTMQTVVTDGGGTFYLFYDKYQMIQGGTQVEYELPECIQDSDCRLTLHRNCRNTKEIAKTSVTPLKDKKRRAIKPITACVWFKPVKPIMHIVQNQEDEIASLNKVLEKYKENEIKDVVILTQGTIDFSCIAHLLEDEGRISEDGYNYYKYNGKKYRVSTCIKFKGLEADAIVMIDLKKESFVGKKGLQFYVGSSRAKIRLDLLCNIAPTDYYYVVHELDPNAPKRNNAERMRKILGSTFSADVVLE